MDLVRYRGIDFPVLRSISWEREPILDPSGTTYLYTRWRGNVVVTYNPATIAYRPGATAGAPGKPRASPIRATVPLTFGTMPAATDAAIRAWIEKPRGDLLVMSAGVQVIRSPGFIGGEQMPCDAATGPTLKVNSIQQIPGERRWDIHLSIETCVNEPQFDVTTRASTASWSPIISNRWAAIGDTDFQQKTVRAYQGTVTVRGDLLNSVFGLGATGVMDSLRNAFAAFSVPIGFQRVAVNVRCLPDGNSAEYTVVDAQQMWNKDARYPNNPNRCPALRLDIQDSVWVSRWTQNVVRDAVRITLLNTALALTGNGGKIMPKSYRRVNVRGWGASTMRRDVLANFCLDVAKARLQDLALLDVSTEEIMVTQDTDNFVDVSITRSWDFSANGAVLAVVAPAIIRVAAGAIENAVGGGYQAALDAMVDNPDYLYAPDEIVGPPKPLTFLAPQAPPQTPRPRDYVQATPPQPGHPVGLTVNPAFPDAGTRGTYLADLVTQVLEAPDTLPAAPP